MFMFDGSAPSQVFNFCRIAALTCPTPCFTFLLGAVLLFLFSSSCYFIAGLVWQSVLTCPVLGFLRRCLAEEHVLTLCCCLLPF